MAIKQTNENRDFFTSEFVFDTAAEVSNLPTDCGIGSTAICIATGKVYILGTNGWSEF